MRKEDHSNDDFAFQMLCAPGKRQHNERLINTATNGLSSR